MKMLVLTKLNGEYIDEARVCLRHNSMD